MEQKQIWPGWETIELLGTGGFSEVYKIKKVDESGDFFSALKVISIPKTKDEYQTYQAEGYDEGSITQIFKSQVDDLVKEFKLMSQFRGMTNIVSYEDHMIIPKEDGIGWDVLIRMELLTTLQKRCINTPLDERETTKLGVDICNALTLCEKFQIVHRDIKPQNIFVNNFGDYKLGDFGVARAMDHTTHATKIGTCSYMAPEVYRGEAYNATADIYSLGLVLYWLLNERRLPFMPMPPAVPTASDTSEAYNRRFAGESIPAPKNGSAELKEIVLKACAFNPKDRFQTAAEMGAALSAVLHNTPKAAAAVIPAVAVDFDDKTELITNADNADETVLITAQEAEDDKTMLLIKDADADGDKTELITKQEDDGAIVTPAPVIVPTPTEPQKAEVTETNPTTDSGKKKKWWIVLIAALLIVVVIVCIILMRGCDGHVDDAGASTTTSAETTTTTENDSTSNSSTTTGSTGSTATTAPVISKVTVSKQPTKTTYYVGDTFDYSGLTLKVVYSNGETKTVNNGFTCDSVTFKSAGEQSITVNYEDKKTIVKVTVKKNTVERISIVGHPNTYYIVGQSLDTSGLALKVVYSNGTEKTITSGFTCTPQKFMSSGKTQVKVSFGGKETTFTVTVSDVAVTSVLIKSLPTKKSYYVGDALNTAGLVLNVKYNDGTTETVSAGFACTPSVLNKVGTVTVSANYGGKSATFTVSVEEVKPTSISVRTPPAKTKYFVGDTLNTSGLSLTVRYNNGATSMTYSGFSCSPTTLSSAGTKTITVTYGGKSTTFTVGVDNIYPSFIAIKSKPTKISYYVGDTLDTSGLTLTVTNNNGSTETVSSGFSCSPTTFSSSGTKTITVTYSGKTTTFTVSVADVAVSSIAIKSKPSKTSYYVGDTLNTSGLMLTATYNNGTTKTISSGFSCSPTSFSSSGTKTITVTYSGKTTTFAISVTDVAVSSIAIKSKPSKTSYYVGDTLNTSGLMLTATYNNGSTKTVSSGFSCTPTTFNTASNAQKITVSYSGKTTSFTVSVNAKGADITWSLLDGTLTISGKGPMKDYNALAPEPEDWRAQKNSIKKVVIQYGVTSISNEAFTWCQDLSSVTIPNSVTSIGECAFVSCNSLTSITIPNSVTSIGDEAFYYCDSLESVSYRGTKAQWAKVSKGFEWDDGCPFTVVHCTDGDVNV